MMSVNQLSEGYRRTSVERRAILELDAGRDELLDFLAVDDLDLAIADQLAATDVEILTLALA